MIVYFVFNVVFQLFVMCTIFVISFKCLCVLCHFMGFFGSSLFGVFGGPEKGRLVWVFVSAWRVCFGDKPSFLCFFSPIRCAW